MKSVTIDFEHKYNIGQLDGDINNTFNFIIDIEIDNSGNVYVLDGGDHIIKVFDKNGSFLRSIGREGRGPGEMTNPGMLKITPKGELLLIERDITQVSKFDLGGSFVSSNIIRSLGFGYVGDVIIDQTGHMYFHKYTHQKKEELIHKHDSEGEYQFSFAEQVTPQIKRTFPHLNAGKMAFDDNGKIVEVLPYPYTIRFFDTDGNLLNSVEKQIPYAKPPFIHPNGVLVTMFVIQDVEIYQEYIFVLTSVIDDPTLGEDRVVNFYIDIFNFDGELIDHKKISEDYIWAFTLFKNQLYFGHHEPYPHISVHEIKKISN